MDIFIGQPNFAGKTYLKFQRQESKQRIRQEPKLPVQEVQLIEMHSVIIAAFTLRQQIVLLH